MSSVLFVSRSNIDARSLTSTYSLSLHVVLPIFLELGARERLVQEDRVFVRVDRDVREVDRGGLPAGQLDLGLLRGLTQTLERHLVLGQVDAVLRLELLDQPVDDPDRKSVV